VWKRTVGFNLGLCRCTDCCAVTSSLATEILLSSDFQSPSTFQTPRTTCSPTLMNYLTLNNLSPSLQSGFRPGHSTETAILLVLSEIIQAVGSGDFAALVLLDLSAAFDTVDHEILLQRLHKLRHKRSSPPMVSVVPSRPNPTCPSWFNDIVSCSLGLRCSPGLSDRADLVRSLHGRLDCTHHEPWAVTYAPLC